MKAAPPALLFALILLAPAAPARAAGPAGLLSVEFEGGTAADYIAALRRAAGELNVVVAPEAAEVRLPRVSLKHVTPAAALEILQDRAAEGRGRRVHLNVLQMPLHAEGERQTYQVRADVRGAMFSERAARVWNVEMLIQGGIPADAVLSAVEMALAVVASPTELDVRFHEDTALLIASGDQGQLSAIEAAVSELETVAALRHSRSRREAERDRLEEKAAKLDEARAELQALRNEVQRLQLLEQERRRMLHQRDDAIERLEAELRQARLVLEESHRDRDRQQAPPR